MRYQSTLLLCIACVVASSERAFSVDSRPNILLIVGDDMGYADVGFHGCNDIPTPHLDAISASGIRFTSGYVSGPYCSPTRAGLLTGRYQVRFGHEFNPGNGDQGLPTQEITLADRLHSAGYKTGLVGKWHLGSTPEEHPQERGFDEFFGFLGGGHSYFESNGILRGNEPVQDVDYLTDVFGRESCAFVERHKGQPWFLYLAFNAVHTPMHATDARLAKFSSTKNLQRQTYNAMMLAMDEAIGSVIAKLKESGQLDNTLVMFISDNGGPTMVGVTVNGSKNDPLRGSKRTTLEGGIRVPFLVSWPAKLKPAVYDKPAIQLDLHTTALAAAGIELQPQWKLDGINLLPHLTNENQTAPHDSLYWRFGDQMAIRSGDWKLVRYDLNAETQTGLRQDVTAAKLYNLAMDIHEDHDLASQNPSMVSQLQAQWDKWNQGNVAPLWGGRGAGDEKSSSKQPSEKKKNRKKAKAGTAK